MRVNGFEFTHNLDDLIVERKTWKENNNNHQKLAATTLSRFQSK